MGRKGGGRRVVPAPFRFARAGARGGTGGAASYEDGMSLAAARGARVHHGAMLGLFSLEPT
jgi:hypothetical protein